MPLVASLDGGRVVFGESEPPPRPAASRQQFSACRVHVALSDCTRWGGRPPRHHVPRFAVEVNIASVGRISEAPCANASRRPDATVPAERVRQIPGYSDRESASFSQPRADSILRRRMALRLCALRGLQPGQARAGRPCRGLAVFPVPSLRGGRAVSRRLERRRCRAGRSRRTALRPHPFSASWLATAHGAPLMRPTKFWHSGLRLLRSHDRRNGRGHGPARLVRYNARPTARTH
jgi:hypothetical protein